MRLNLWAKFSIFLLIAWLVVSSSTLLLLSKHIKAQAEADISERAAIVLNAMQSVRNYTRDNIQPLLKDHPTAFIQEGIPNFAARSVFKEFQQLNPDLAGFAYKEATPNPTNPKDLADEFEEKIFAELQKSLESNQTTEELSGYRSLNDKKLFYSARPIIVNDVSCLECHGNSQDAPEYLINMYGSQNGFGWKLNDVVAAQIVYAPADVIFARGHHNILSVATILFSILGAIFVVVNLLLWRTVISPLRILTNTAKILSQYSNQTPKDIYSQDQRLIKLTRRQDEPGQLARAFHHMIDILSRREQDLQLAVQERTQSLQQEMLDRQTAQDALKTYSNAMNHDLRNLVIGISNIMQSILFRSARNIVDSESETERITIDPKALNMIQQSCDRQLQLMNSLMDVQSADIWQLARKQDRVNLGELAQNITDFYKPGQVSRLKSFNNRIPLNIANVQGDSNQLRRVFENLIANALKYNPQGVDLTLTASILNAEPCMIRCAVIDNGIGIDLAKSEELFKIYARGNNASQIGYGLGLYICRKIIEVHGGEIGVEGSSGTGVEFWFTLPIYDLSLG